LNIVLGRASTTSPSISIFSSLGTRAEGSSAMSRQMAVFGAFRSAGNA
jgi:hypothetical protein